MNNPYSIHFTVVKERKETGWFDRTVVWETVGEFETYPEAEQFIVKYGICGNNYSIEKEYRF